VFALVLCLVLWLLSGISVKLAFGTWYGFGIGFIVAAMTTGLVTWFVFMRTAARERRVVRASWRGHALRIYDPIDKKHDNIDFSMPHRAILILSKAERQFLLRMAQKSGEQETRVDIIGLLPLGLPMAASGEAPSLSGFFRKARTTTDTAKPYRLKEVPDRESMCISLLQFVEDHRDTRDTTIDVRKENDIIRLRDGVFSLISEGREVVFASPTALQLLFMAQPLDSAALKDPPSPLETTETFIAMVSDGNLLESLFFSIIAPQSLASEFATEWPVPRQVMHRKFTLYDDSVNSFVFASTLKQLMKAMSPNSPILDVLRH
jgi:hypothetical protein